MCTIRQCFRVLPWLCYVSYPSSPQPRQAGAPSPGAPPTILPSSSSLCVSSYSNTHVGLPSAQPSSNYTNYSLQCPSSAPVVYSAQSQYNVGHEQYSHRSIPSGSGIDMRHGNVPPNPSDVICLDSDNDVGSWNQLMNPSSTSGGSISQATLLPGPKILTVPFPPATDPTSLSSSSTPFTSSHTPSASQGGPPFNAAVAHLMAYLKEREGSRENMTSNFIPSPVPHNQQTHFSSSPASLSTAQSSLSQGLFARGNEPPFNPPIPGGNQPSLGVSQQPSFGSQLQTLTSHTNTPVGLPMPSSSHHNVTGQYTSNSILGQTEFPNPSATHTGAVGGQFGLPTNLTSVTSSHPAHSSHLSSLLQSTNEPVSLPQPEQPAHSYGSTSSVPSHSVGYDIDPTITALLSSTLPSASDSSTTGFSLSNPTISSSLSTSTSLPPLAQGAVSQSHASHVTHEVSSSPPRPLFSPPKLPLSREGVPVASSQSSLSHSTRVSGPSPSIPFSTNSISQGSISSPSPPAPVTSPRPPPSSLPRSPSTVFTTSPISQPPTPSTSIPLLSPVAAHFFHVSMNKSPKPSLSPGHTPTPSPSPSSHHHPTSSPHMRSPPSVSTATSQTVKSGPTTSASSHSGFHGNATALNHDTVSGLHGNIPGSYGNSCVIK